MDEDGCDVVGLGYHYRGMAIRVSMINDLELKSNLHLQQFHQPPKPHHHLQ